MDFPGLNPVRWVLLTTAAAAGYGKFAGAALVAWIFYGIAALAGVGLLWLLFGPTLVPRGVTRHEEGVFDHPDGRYEHGYSLAVVSLSGPMEGPLRVWCDAPLHDAEVQTETATEGRKPVTWRRISNYQLSIPLGIPPMGLHIRVYSKHAIRTVLVRRRSRKRRKR